MTETQPLGYLALPESGSGPGVLVLHAWWGLNDTIREVCRRLAGEGFLAFAPDLYHGKLAETIEEAGALGEALDAEYQRARQEVAQAAAYLHARSGSPAGGIAVFGFSLGAFYALDLSAADPERTGKVVLFYGSGPADFTKSRAAYLGHFAADDPYEPPENVEELIADLENAGRPVTFYQYPGTSHWFFEPDRPEYQPEAARLAWERTNTFLR